MPYSSLNVLPIFLILLFLCFPFARIKIRKLQYLVPFALLFLIIILYFFVDPHSITNYDTAIKYFFLIFLSLFLPLLITEDSLDVGIRLLWFWAIFICMLQIFHSIPLDLSKGQHYLTVGLPIAIGIIISFGNILYPEKGPIVSIFHIFLILVFFYALFTLFGRSPILYPAFIILATFCVKAIFSKRLTSRLIYLFALLALIALTGWVFFNVLPSFLQDRIVFMFENISNEPRVDAVYMPAINKIIENPFGYGLESSWKIVGFYPHNIFLEIFISSGIVGFLIFLIISLKTIVKSVRIVGYTPQGNKTLCIVSLITIYHFMVWNTSYDLASAYALLPLMAILNSCEDENDFRNNSNTQSARWIKKINFKHF